MSVIWGQYRHFSDKKFISTRKMLNLQSTIRKYLEDFENLTTDALNEIAKVQLRHGQTFDDRIKDHFVGRVQCW